MELARYTEAEAARALGVPHRTLRQWKASPAWPMPHMKRKMGRQRLDNPLLYSEQDIAAIKEWRAGFMYVPRPRTNKLRDQASLVAWRNAVARGETIQGYRTWRL